MRPANARYLNPAFIGSKRLRIRMHIWPTVESLSHPFGIAMPPHRRRQHQPQQHHRPRLHRLHRPPSPLTGFPALDALLAPDIVRDLVGDHRHRDPQDDCEQRQSHHRPADVLGDPCTRREHRPSSRWPASPPACAPSADAKPAVGLARAQAGPHRRRLATPAGRSARDRAGEPGYATLGGAARHRARCPTGCARRPTARTGRGRPGTRLGGEDGRRGGRSALAARPTSTW